MAKAQAQNKASALALARAKLAARRTELAMSNPTKKGKAGGKAKSKSKAKPRGTSKSRSTSAAQLPFSTPSTSRGAARPLSVHEILAHNAGTLRPNPVHQPGIYPATISTRLNPSSAKETPMSSNMSSKQKRALAVGRAKFAALRQAGAAAAPAKKSGSKKSSKKKTASRKPASRKSASRKPASARPVSVRPTVIAVPMPAAAPARKPRKKARKAKKATPMATARKYVIRAERELSRAPKKAKKRVVKKGKLSRTIKAGTYQSKRGHSAITIRRTYPTANPVVEFKQLAFAGGGLLVGIAAADLIDRYVATRAPEKTTAVPEPTALFGAPAVASIQKKADGYRMLASGGGTLVLGLGAYLLKDKAPNVAYGLGGAGAGFGVKFLSQLVSDVIMPLIFKVDPKADAKALSESMAARLYPDKQTWAEGTVAPYALRYGGYTRGLPPHMGGQMAGRFPFVQAPARSVGPVATGAVGCGGGCGQSAMRSAYGFDLSKVFPEPRAKGCSTFNGHERQGCSSCGGSPQPVQPPIGVTPTQPRIPTVPGDTNGGGYVPVTPGGNNLIPVGPEQPTGEVVNPSGGGFRYNVAVDQNGQMVATEVAPNFPWNGNYPQNGGTAITGTVKGAPETEQHADGQVSGPSEPPVVLSIGDLVRLNRSRKAR